MTSANQSLDLTPTGPLNTLASIIVNNGVISGQGRFNGMLSWNPKDNPAQSIRPYAAFYGIIGLFRAGYLLNNPLYTQTAWNALFAFQQDMDGAGFTHDYVYGRQFTDGIIAGGNTLTSPVQGQFIAADTGRLVTGQLGVSGTVTATETSATTLTLAGGVVTNEASPQTFNLLYTSIAAGGGFVTRQQNFYNADSTDAYAGMFMLAVYAGWRATRNAEQVRLLAPGIRNALSALTVSKQLMGNFWELPTYTVTALQDMCEVYAGCRAAQYLLGPRQIITGYPEEALVAARYADQAQEFVMSLWDYTTAGHQQANGVGTTAGSNILTGAFVAGDVGSAIGGTSHLSMPLGATVIDVAGGSAYLDRPASLTFANVACNLVIPGFRWTQDAENLPQQNEPDWATLGNAYQQIWPVMFGVLDPVLATNQINHYLYTNQLFYADSGALQGGAGEWALVAAGRQSEALTAAVSATASTYATAKGLATPFGYPFTVDKFGQLMVAISGSVIGPVIPPREI